MSKQRAGKVRETWECYVRKSNRDPKEDWKQGESANTDV
jgi:hypothetical protein